MTTLLDLILPKLSGADTSRWPDNNGEYWALCPYHSDENATNFSVSERGFNCFACGASGSLKELASKVGLDIEIVPEGCTLAQYATVKKLPEGFLRGLGIEEIRERRGNTKIPVLHIPYKDEAGKRVGLRKRQAMNKSNGTDDRFLWGKGSTIIPYGVWRLHEWRDGKWLLLVEGESDCHTAWLSGIPCLGIPGSHNWKSDWKKYLEGFSSVYAWKEPDQGGNAFVSSLRRDLPDAMALTPPEGIKDLSAAMVSGRDVPALIEELKAAATPIGEAQGATTVTADPEGIRYEVNDRGEMVMVRPGETKIIKSGLAVELPDTVTTVANFNARIVRETRVLDGETLQATYTVEGFCHDSPFRVEIGADEFRDERKSRSIIGGVAGWSAQVLNLVHFPLAIQSLSNEVTRETRYQSMGWQHIDGKLLFITPSAAGDGYCEVGEELRRYCVEPGDTAKGIDALVNGLMEAFDHRQTYFCVAHAFLPPLFRWITTAKRYVLHLVGETGSLKTTYSCSLLCLYGKFLNEEPTEKWTSTISKIEVAGYAAKDVLFLVDDFKGRNVSVANAVNLIHNYSESRGRGRLNRDSTVKRTYWIRAAIISTGEDIPEGEASVLSRMLVVRLNRPKHGGPNERLRYAQDNAEHLPAVMYEYTRWLAQNVGKEEEKAIDHLFYKWRDEFIAKCPESATNPGRIATNLAQNKVAFNAMARFLQYQGAWSEEEVAKRMAEYDEYADDMLAEMAGRVTEEKSSAGFIAGIRALLESGKGELLPRYGKVDQSGKEIPPTPTPGKELLGWKDEDTVYLLASASYHAVEQWYRQVGGSLGFSRNAVYEQLAEDGVLEKGFKDSTTVIKVGGKTARVIRVRRSAIEEEEEREDLPF